MLLISYSMAVLLCHMLARVLLATSPPTSLLLTFGMLIHCLSHMDPKSKLPASFRIAGCRLSCRGCQGRGSKNKLVSFTKRASCFRQSFSSPSHSSSRPDSPPMPWPPSPDTHFVITVAQASVPFFPSPRSPSLRCNRLTLLRQL